MHEILSRGPFAVAYSANLADQLLILGGRAANNALEAVDLPGVVPQPSRLKERNILEALAGPSATTINRLGLLAVTLANAATGEQSDVDALPRQLQQALPFGSLIYVRALEAALGED